MKSCRGQVLSLALVMILCLAFLWVSLLNVAKLIKDRVQMQIAADTAVQTACAYRARALNIAGVLNGWLGTPVVGIGIPQAAWWPAPPHPYNAQVALQSINDIKAAIQESKKFSSGKEGINYQTILQGLLMSVLSMARFAYDTHDDYAQKQQDFIQTVMQVQNNYIKTYAGGYALLKAREVAQAQGADDVYIPQGMLSVHLKRHRGLIWYLKTIHVWNLFISNYPIITAPFTPMNEDDGDADQWEMQGSDFYRQSVRLYAYRRPDSAFNGNFPMGQNVMNLQMPYFYTVAAARIFNPDGPMFPALQESDGYLGGIKAEEEYNDAANGWHSQLIPVGGLYAH